MESIDSGKVKSISLLLLTVLGWGVMYPASKHAVSNGIDGIYLTLIRYGLGTLLVSSILLATEGRRSFDYESNRLKVWIFGTIGFGGLNFLTFIGISYSSAEHATIILALMPMLSIALSVVTEGARPTTKTLGCSLAAFLGIAMVITKGRFNQLASSASVLGDFLLLAATFCWVVYTHFAKSMTGWSALRTTALSSLLGTLSIIVIALAATLLGVTRPPALEALSSSWIDIVILVATTAVIVSWNAGIKGLGAVNGVLFVNLVPVVTFAIGFFHGHAVDGVEVAGATLTIFALIANNLISRVPARASAFS